MEIGSSEFDKFYFSCWGVISATFNPSKQELVEGRGNPLRVNCSYDSKNSSIIGARFNDDNFPGFVCPYVDSSSMQVDVKARTISIRSAIYRTRAEQLVSSFAEKGLGNFVLNS